MSAATDTNRVVCAWCDRTLQEGCEPVSHGICEDCAGDVLARIDQRLSAREHAMRLGDFSERERCQDIRDDVGA